MGIRPHVMWWPSHLDKGYNQAQEFALREMISKHDQPRKGLAGGISEIRLWRGKAQSFDIAGLGTEGSHTGLIKSFTQEGSFEEPFIRFPFTAHAGIHLLNERDESPYPRGEPKSPPSQLPARAVWLRSILGLKIRFPAPLEMALRGIPFPIKPSCSKTCCRIKG